jgi:hypothetical protein
MHYLQAGSFTAPFAGAVIGLGSVFGASSDGATEFMLRPQMWIKQRTAYTGTAEVAIRCPSPLSSQEIVAWLREEGIPIAVIAEVAGVERKSVYAWLSGGAVKTHNQERLEKVYSLLNENKLTSLRHLYRFWSRSIIGEQSLASMLQDKVLDEKSIRNALSQLWPLAKKEETRESLSPSNSSIKSNSFLRESREVTSSYDT